VVTVYTSRSGASQIISAIVFSRVGEGNRVSEVS
jgi:hypothetical protein